MMRYNNDEICSELYKEIREYFPDMTFSHFKEIVRSPWGMLRKNIESDSYRPVRLHFFGVFSCSVGNTIRCYNNAVKAFEKGKISEEEFRRIEEKTKKIREYYEKEKED